MSEFKVRLPVDLQKQYTILRIYSFCWWACFSLFLIFQPLFLVRNGFPIWVVFLNGAFDAMISMLFQSSWSNYSDKHGNIRQFMFVGNIFMAVACFIILFVTNIWSLLLLTLVFRMGPSSDTFATTLVYKLADISTPEHLRANTTDKKGYAISFFSHYRKFGSIGWAFIAPVGGILINKFDFGLNFILAGIGFLLITVLGIFTIKTDSFFKRLNVSPPVVPFDKKQLKKQNGVIYSVGDLLKNKRYFVFLLAGFFYTVASTMTYQTQGIFYGLFAPKDFFAIGMTYSVAAFIEWPVMSVIAKSVKKSSWENIIVLSYTFTAIRFLFSPLLIILGANIWWAYFFQIFTGIIFGMRWPATTLGIHSVLRDDQKTLGQSFFGSASLVASLTGSIIGAIISFIIKDNIGNSFIVLYWVAAVLSTISAIWFYKKSKGKNCDD